MARYAKFFSVGGGAGPNGLQLPLGTVLDATLRQVQDGTGTGSPLYLSTGSVRIGTTAGSAMYWDNTNNRLGIGVTSSTDLTAQLSVGNTDFVVGANAGYSTYYGSSVNGTFQITPSGNNTQLFIRPSGAAASFNSAYWSRIQNAAYTTQIAMGEYHSYLSLGRPSIPQMASLFDSGNFVVGSSSDLSARLGIRGSGSTSATTSLLVQNSGGTNLLQVKDNGDAVIYGDNNTWGQGWGYLLRQSGGIIYGSNHNSVTLKAAVSWGLGNNSGSIGASNGTIDYSSSNTPNVEQTNILRASQYQHGVGEGRFLIQAQANAGGYNAIGNMYIAGGRNTNGGAHGNVYLGVDLTGALGNVGIGTTIPTQKLDVNGVSRFRDTLNIDNNKSLGFAYVGGTSGFSIVNSSTNQFQINNANYGYNLITIPDSASSTAAVGIGTTSPTAKLQVKGNGSTSATTSLLVQNSSNVDLLKITDDSTFYLKGASGTTLRIKSAIEANSSVIQFNNEGLTGGFSGGYTFTNGSNGNYGSTVSLRIYPGKVGIGNITEGTMQNNAMNLYVDNTQTGGRNKAIKLNVNFANITTEYNGINFDTIENGVGGAFVGSQHNPLTNGYDSDLSIFCTSGSSNSYFEVGRFIGKYNSLYLGTNKTLANASAKLQVESTTQGFLPPRVTTIQKNAIATPAAGLMVYDTDLARPCFFNGATWTTL